MRQVPHYLLIGNGRVARHFHYYFSLLSLSFESWHRQQPLFKLQHQLNTSALSHIMLLINDDSIEDFILKNLNSTKAVKIHFSGSLVTPYAYGAHPLMSFNDHLYDIKQYQSIGFVIDHDAPEFEILLPGLSNKHIRLNISKKPKYHALCVLSGNFSCLLWKKLFDTLESEFNIPHSIAYPYLLQLTQNIVQDYTSALTGPLVRQDKITIENNIKSLKKDPFQKIYRSFVSCYLSEKERI